MTAVQAMPAAATYGEVHSVLLKKKSRSGGTKNAGATNRQQAYNLLELIRCTDLGEHAEVVVDRLVVASLIQRAVRKDRIVRRGAVENVVHAAVDRPVLEARVRHHQVELAIRAGFARGG